jgi:hypothetical protein
MANNRKNTIQLCIQYATPPLPNACIDTEFQENQEDNRPGKLAVTIR